MSVGKSVHGEGNSKPTPVFLPGESHGRRSLGGYSPRGRKELAGTGEPGGLPSLGLHRVGRDSSDLVAAAAVPLLEKEMATDSSVLAWRIPGTGEPGGLPSLGSHRVGHD